MVTKTDFNAIEIIGLKENSQKYHRSNARPKQKNRKQEISPFFIVKKSEIN